LGEQVRLKKARLPGNDKHTLLHAILLHPLPGANYRYAWKVRRAED